MESHEIALNESLLDFDLVKQVLIYDPETGTITRTMDCGAGKKGQVFTKGRISIRCIHIAVSRLAWALHNGMWPPNGYLVDHINRDKTDNKITNLRLATPTQNQHNKPGYGEFAKGVTWRDRRVKPWQAKIRVNGTRIHLGSFETEDDAAEAYKQAAIKHHGEFACLNKADE